jgi:hypothetical protein
MSSKTSPLLLSASGLSLLQAVHKLKDFSFEIDGRIYLCDAFSASFISPLVCRLRAIDPTFNYLHLSSHDPHRLFPRVFDLMHGEAVDLTDDLVLFLSHIGSELENDEILRFISDRESSFEPLTMSNIESRLIRRPIMTPIPIMHNADSRFIGAAGK